MKYHIVLTEKDADIIAFKNYIPHGTFNKWVVRILRHAISGEPIEETFQFDIDYLVPKAHTKIDLPADLVKQLKKRFKGPFTTCVKEEIKRFIKSHREATAKQRFRIDGLRMVLSMTEKEMARMRLSHEKQPGRYKELSKKYEKLIDCMIEEIVSKAHTTNTIIETVK